MDETGERPGFDAAGYAVAAFALFVLAAQNSLARWAVQNGMTAEDLVAIRFCLPGLVLLPVFLRQVRGDRREWLRSLAVAFGAGVPYGLVLTSGYEYSTATHGSVIVPSATLTSGVLLSALVLRQPVSRWTVAAVLTAVAGMAVVSGFWREGEGGSLTGDLLFVLSGLIWASHLVAVGKWRMPARRVVPAVMACGLLYAPVYLATASLPGELLRGEGPPTRVVVTCVLFLAVLHSLCALPAYAWAVGRLTPMRMSLLTPSIPVMGVAVAVSTLGESLEANEVLGGVLVLAALTIAGRSKVRRVERNPTESSA